MACDRIPRYADMSVQAKQGVEAMAYINATEAARRLGVSEKTVRRWIKQERLTAFHPRGYKNRLAIAEQDVEALAQEIAELVEQGPGPGAPVDTERLAALERRVEALESQLERLVTALAGTPGKAAQSPLERATGASIPTVSKGHPAAAPVDLPAGSISIGEFAARHGVNDRTFRDQVTKGLKRTGERIEATERPKPNRPGEVERWLTPAQQSGAIQFWLEHGTVFVSCPACPHGNAEYAALLGEESGE